MAPHKYGRYLHILTPAGADGAHVGPQPWEGITGRVKQLVRQESNRVMDVIEQSNATNQRNELAIKGVEARLQTQLEGLQAQLQVVLEAQQQMLSTTVGQKK